MRVKVRILSSDWGLPYRSAARAANLRPVMQDVGLDHIRTIQHRIAAGVDFRGVPLQPLSEVTLKIREWKGNTRTSPLWETGNMKSSWVSRAKRRSVTVRPRRPFTKGAPRSMYGLPSSIHKRPVPIRDAFSMSEDQRHEYGRWIFIYTSARNAADQVTRKSYGLDFGGQLPQTFVSQMRG